jgi:glycosyltransferase involved in cell wall biosynthesis
MKLGVAIPCYKYHIPVLKRCLDSIEQQTRKPDIVVVSCSSSVKDDIPQSYYEYSFPVRIYTHRMKMNAAENRNFAGLMLQGLNCDIFSFFDCDDEMHPQRLKAIEHAFETLEECGIVLHSYLYEKDDLAKPFPLYKTLEISMNLLEKAPTGCAVLKSNWSSPIHHSQVSVQKDIFKQIKFRENSAFAREGANGGNEDALFCGDVLALKGPNVYIANPLSKYYQEGQTYDA